MVDASDLGSDAERREGSSPLSSTNKIRERYMSYYGMGDH